MLTQTTQDVTMKHPNNLPLQLLKHQQGTRLLIGRREICSDAASAHCCIWPFLLLNPDTPGCHGVLSVKALCSAATLTCADLLAPVLPSHRASPLLVPLRPTQIPSAACPPPAMPALWFLTPLPSELFLWLSTLLILAPRTAGSHPPENIKLQPKVGERL